MARRAGCIERCLSGSREAAVSKARSESIYSFYPIGLTVESGRPGKTEFGKCPGADHDILDFCVRELGALGGGGAIIDACSCQAVHRVAIVAGRR